MPEPVEASAASGSLVRSDLVLQGLLSISSEAIITANPDQRVTFFSPGAERIFGYRAAEILGQPLEVLMPQRFRHGHRAHVSNFAAGVSTSKLMQDRQGVFGLRKDGEEFAIEASISRIETPDGAVFTTIIRDVTERKADEERLANSEQRLRIATQSSDMHVFEIDYQARTLTKAGAEDTFFERPLGYDDVATDLLCWIDARDRAAVAQAWAERNGASGPFKVECRIDRSDGQEIWAALSAESMLDETGRIRRFVGALQNITERRRAELRTVEALAAAEAANNAKSAFLATVSHEIRTPLNGVLGMAQAMSLGELPPDQRERLDVIRRSGETLLAILNDVLDLSKIEAGRLDIEQVAFDLRDVLLGAGEAFSGLAEQKGLQLVIDDGGIAGCFRGDPTRIRQILFNLISNALKFTEHGEVRVSARYRNGRLRLAVSDTGIGMGEAVLESIFQPFTQADASTTRHFGGTGLGLTISQRLAAMMGGRITVSSRPARGSTFTLTLPLTQLGDAESGLAARPGPAAPVQPGRAIRVLAAEDNGVNQLVLRALLQQAAIDPVIVATGQEALEAWRAEPFDLILMDIQMPVMDGPTASRLIRQEEARSGRSRTPIVALTANAMAHQVEAYLAAGMDLTVTKPIKVAELFGAIEAAVSAAADRPEGATVGGTA